MDTPKSNGEADYTEDLLRSFGIDPNHKPTKRELIKRKIDRWWGWSKWSPRIWSVNIHNFRHKLRWRLRENDGSASADIGGWYLIYMTCPACQSDGSFIDRDESGNIYRVGEGSDLTEGYELHPCWQCDSCKKKFDVNWHAYLDEMEPGAMEANAKVNNMLNNLMDSMAENPIELTEEDLSRGQEGIREKFRSEIDERTKE